MIAFVLKYFNKKISAEICKKILGKKNYNCNKKIFKKMFEAKCTKNSQYTQSFQKYYKMQKKKCKG